MNDTPHKFINRRQNQNTKIPLGRKVGFGFLLIKLMYEPLTKKWKNENKNKEEKEEVGIPGNTVSSERWVSEEVAGGGLFCFHEGFWKWVFDLQPWF